MAHPEYVRTPKELKTKRPAVDENSIVSERAPTCADRALSCLQSIAVAFMHVAQNGGTGIATGPAITFGMTDEQLNA